MGFVPERRLFRLVFTDPALDGLTVRVRSVSIGEYLQVLDMTDQQLLEKFAACLVDWNLGPGDSPLPCTLATLKKQDISLVRAMQVAWVRGLIGVSPPLPEPSNPGETSAEVSLELASSSRSLAS